MLVFQALINSIKVNLLHSLVLMFQLLSSSEMLSQCFNHLFSQLLNRRVNLDTVLQLWLTMNEDSAHDDTPLHTSFDPSRIPSVPLTGSSLAHLLEAVVLTPNLPVRSWVFVFQTLCLFSNQRTASQVAGPDVSMVNAVLKESNLMPLLVKFLSGVSTSGPTAASIYYSQVCWLIQIERINVYITLLK